LLLLVPAPVPERKERPNHVRPRRRSGQQLALWLLFLKGEQRWGLQAWGQSRGESNENLPILVVSAAKLFPF